MKSPKEWLEKWRGVAIEMSEEIDPMNVAQHAEQILAAWKRADPASFEQELNNAMKTCQRAESANYFESEQREVLGSVVERLRLMRPQRSGMSTADQLCSPQSLHAGFHLLEHLRQRAAA